MGTTFRMRILHHCHFGVEFTEFDRCERDDDTMTNAQAWTDVSVLLFFIKFNTMFHIN